MTLLLRHIIVILLCAVCVQPAIARKSSIKAQAVKESDARKADYLYLEAKRQALQERYDSYFELMDYAHRLNPEDRAIGMDLGIYYLQLDSIGSTRGIDLMQAYVEENPDDLYKWYTYASIAQKLGQDQRALEAWRTLHERFPTRDGVTVKYATMLRRNSDPDMLRRAVELYDSLELGGADPVQIAGMKASVYLQLGDTSAVIDVAQRLRARNPKSSYYNLFVGNIYQSFLSSDSAIVYYDRAVELDPSNGMAYYARAGYYNEINDSVAYDREVFNALHQPDLDLDIKLAMLRDYVAELYTDSLQQPRITELFTSLQSQHPHQADISDLYADYLIAIQDLEGAAEQVSYSLDLRPDDLRKWRMLSSLYLSISDYPRTVDAATRALHYFPHDTDLYQIRAIGLASQGKYDEALNLYKESIQFFEHSDSIDSADLSELYSGLGDCYHRMDSISLAFSAYEKAIEMDHDNLSALNNYAYQLACEGRELDRAKAMAEKVIAAKPDDATSLDTYAWVLFKMKDYSKARKIIDHTMECDENPSAELLEHAGDIYFMDGEPDKALDFWQQALNLDPDNSLLRRKVTHKTYFYK